MAKDRESYLRRCAVARRRSQIARGPIDGCTPPQSLSLAGVNRAFSYEMGRGEHEQAMARGRVGCSYLRGCECQFPRSPVRSRETASQQVPRLTPTRSALSRSRTMGIRQAAECRVTGRTSKRDAPILACSILATCARAGVIHVTRNGRVESPWLAPEARRGQPARLLPRAAHC